MFWWFSSLQTATAFWGQDIALSSTHWQLTLDMEENLTNVSTHIISLQKWTTLIFCSSNINSIKIIPFQIYALLWIIAVSFLIGDPPSTGASALGPLGPGRPLAIDRLGPVVTVSDTLSSATPLQNKARKQLQHLGDAKKKKKHPHLKAPVLDPNKR